MIRNMKSEIKTSIPAPESQFDNVKLKLHCIPVLRNPNFVPGANLKIRMTKPVELDGDESTLKVGMTISLLETVTPTPWPGPVTLGRLGLQISHITSLHCRYDDYESNRGLDLRRSK
eukprot:g29601.t1